MREKKTVTVDPEVAKKDTNGDGHISQEEMEMDLEFKRNTFEDADARRDAMRQMHGSPSGVCYCTHLQWLCKLIGLDQHQRF